MHARRYDAIDGVGNKVQHSRQVTETGFNACQNVAQTTEHLQAIVEADEAVIAWVRLELEVIHQIVACSGYRHARKTAHFAAEACFRA